MSIGERSGKQHDGRTLSVSRRSGSKATDFDNVHSRLRASITTYFQRRNGHTAVHEDLAQEVFLRFHRANRSFLDESACKAYVFGIARNVLYEHRRTIKREAEIRESLKILAQNSDNRQPADVLHCRTLHKAIAHAKSKLSHKQRQALETAITDLTTTQAAQQLDISVAIYRERLRRARERLIRDLEALSLGHSIKRKKVHAQGLDIK